MSYDFTQYTQPIPLPENNDENDEGEKGGKDKKNNNADQEEEDLKQIKQNNALFEQTGTESDISEVQDPLHMTGYQSERVFKNTLLTKLKQFEIDANRFEKGKDKRAKNSTKPTYKFTDAKI